MSRVKKGSAETFQKKRRPGKANAILSNESRSKCKGKHKNGGSYVAGPSEAHLCQVPPIPPQLCEKDSQRERA